MSDLRSKAVNSVLWTTIRTIVTALSGPLLLVLKARYLTPAEFGVMSIINVFIAIIAVVENFGFGTAVIQRDHVSKDERSSLFILQMLVCLVLGILLIASSSLFANIFDMPALSNLLPILSLTIFFNGPVILFTAFLEKEFHFKELSIIQIIREVTLFITTSAFFIFFDLGLLGVVLGQVIAVAVMAVLIIFASYRLNLLHIRFHFKWMDVRPFVKFGINVAGKQMSTQLTHHVDELIIGYFMSAQVLGYYHFAKNLLNKLRGLISTAFSKVLFPILSKVKNDLGQLSNVYNKISKYIGMFAFPIFIGIAITARVFIPVLFGEQWVASTNFFIILSIAYIPYLVTGNISTSLLYSRNRPNVVLFVDLIVNGIYILLLLFLSWMQWGIYSIVFLYAIYLVIKIMTLQAFASQELHSTLSKYLSLFIYPAAASIVMIIGVLAVQWIFVPLFSELIVLILSIVVGAIVYFGVYYLIDRQTIFDLISTVRNR